MGIRVDTLNKTLSVSFEDGNGDPVPRPTDGTPQFTSSDMTVLRLQFGNDPWSVSLIPVATGKATVSLRVLDGLGRDYPDFEMPDPVHIDVDASKIDYAVLTVSDTPPDTTPPPPNTDAIAHTIDPRAPGGAVAQAIDQAVQSQRLPGSSVPPEPTPTGDGAAGTGSGEAAPPAVTDGSAAPAGDSGGQPPTGVGDGSSSPSPAGGQPASSVGGAGAPPPDSSQTGGPSTPATADLAGAGGTPGVGGDVTAAGAPVETPADAGTVAATGGTGADVTASGAPAETPPTGGGDPLGVNEPQYPGGTVNQSYSYETPSGAVWGGQAPYAWQASGLPAGLAMDVLTGNVTGTPTTAGSFSVSVSVTDAANATVTTTGTISVAAAS